MVGDILYRWGNPSNYGMFGPQVIPNAVHDARWITNDGRPNSGFLQIFNNSGISKKPKITKIIWSVNEKFCRCFQPIMQNKEHKVSETTNENK